MSTSRLPHKDFRSHGSDWRANYQVIQRSYRKSLSSSIDDHVPYLCWITRRGFPQFSLVYHCDMWWFLTAETNSRQRRWTLATSKLKFGTVHQWGFPQMESSLKWKYPKSSSPIQSFDHDFVLKQPRLICGSVSKKFKKCIKWWLFGQNGTVQGSKHSGLKITIALKLLKGKNRRFNPNMLLGQWFWSPNPNHRPILAPAAHKDQSLVGKPS